MGNDPKRWLRSREDRHAESLAHTRILEARVFDSLEPRVASPCVQQYLMFARHFPNLQTLRLYNDSLPGLKYFKAFACQTLSFQVGLPYGQAAEEGPLPLSAPSVVLHVLDHWRLIPSLPDGVKDVAIIRFRMGDQPDEEE